MHVAIQDAMGWSDCHLHELICTDDWGEGLGIGSLGDEGSESTMPGW